MTEPRVRIIAYLLLIALMLYVGVTGGA